MRNEEENGKRRGQANGLSAPFPVLFLVLYHSYASLHLSVFAHNAAELWRDCHRFSYCTSVDYGFCWYPETANRSFQKHRRASRSVHLKSASQPQSEQPAKALDQDSLDLLSNPIENHLFVARYVHGAWLQK